MNISTTIEQIKGLKLIGMVDALEELMRQPEASNLAFEERLGIIIDREVIYRDNKRRIRLLRYAKLRFPTANMENIDYQHKRGLNRGTMLSFTSCDWIRRQQNIIFVGPTGVGKSYLSCALGQQACRQGIRVRYYRMSKLLEDLRVEQAKNEYSRFMKNISNFELLIIDDWGLGTLNKIERHDILELLEDRYNIKSTIIATQLPISNWHEYIGDATIADAILDRVLSNSYKIILDGLSMRPPGIETTVLEK
jgi:DNA replication protein DnaC